MCRFGLCFLTLLLAMGTLAATDVEALPRESAPLNDGDLPEYLSCIESCTDAASAGSCLHTCHGILGPIANCHEEHNPNVDACLAGIGAWEAACFLEPPLLLAALAGVLGCGADWIFGGSGGPCFEALFADHPCHVLGDIFREDCHPTIGVCP